MTRQICSYNGTLELRWVRILHNWPVAEWDVIYVDQRPSRYEGAHARKIAAVLERRALKQGENTVYSVETSTYTQY